MIKRHISGDILDSLEHFPVVLITGARQVGKSTLVQELAKGEWPAQYLTLDSRMVLDVALIDPDGLIKSTPVPVILDEVQRAPDLLRAVKLAVDRDRKPGQYLLTGSANLMTLSKVSETLAGRIALHELQPFSWPEIGNKKAPEFLKDVFLADHAGTLLKKWKRQSFPDRREEVKDRILAGGYPTPSLMASLKARRRWFDSYRQTYIERDIRNMATLEHVPAFNRLLSLLSFRTGQIVNFSEISRELGLPFTTVRRYMDLLETTYQIFYVRPYFANIGKRLIKMPKVYLSDTGMACHLSAVENWETLERQGRTGNMVETWAALELRKLISTGDFRCQIYYWRTYAGKEVDFLLEQGERVVAVEVKWGQHLGESDLAGLRDCARDLKGRHRLSILLYPGTETVAVDRQTIIVPFGFFLGMES